MVFVKQIRLLEVIFLKKEIDIRRYKISKNRKIKFIKKIKVQGKSLSKNFLIHVENTNNLISF